MTRLLIGMAAVALAVGCESEAETLRRLRANVDSARSEIARLEAEIDKLGGGPQLRTIREQAALDERYVRTEALDLPADTRRDTVTAIRARNEWRAAEIERISAQWADSAFLAQVDSLEQLIEDAEIRLQIAERDLRHFLE